MVQIQPPQPLEIRGSFTSSFFVSKASLSIRKTAKHKTIPLFENPPEAMPVSGGGTAKQNFSTFQQAKTADVYYRAMLAKAKLKMITGETIDRKKAGQYAFNLGRSLRDLFISFPTRYGSLIAAEIDVDEHKMVTVLDEYIRKLLTERRDIIDREL